MFSLTKANPLPVCCSLQIDVFVPFGKSSTQFYACPITFAEPKANSEYIDKKYCEQQDSRGQLCIGFRLMPQFVNLEG